MKAKTSKSYTESGQDIFPIVHIHYEFIEPSISNPRFNLSEGMDTAEDTSYLVSPQVDRFSEAWEKLAKK